MGFKALVFHRQMSQSKRLMALNSFKADVLADVCARALVSKSLLSPFSHSLGFKVIVIHGQMSQRKHLTALNSCAFTLVSKC